MTLPRREFLKLLGVTAAATGLGCGRRWLVPDHLLALARRGPGTESAAQTICGLCGGGCGLTVRLVDGIPVGLKGNPHHPLSRGGLCPVGQAGLEVLYAPARLQGPMRRESNGEHRAVPWDTALAEIAARLRQLTASGEGHRVAFVTDAPGALWRDLMLRFAQSLGSPNVASPLPAFTSR